MATFWTEELVDRVVTAMKTGGDDAVDGIARELGRTITYDAIRRACDRHKGVSLSTLLSDEREDGQEVKVEVKQEVQNKYEELLTVIANKAAALPASPKVPRVNTADVSEETMFLDLSDVHMGSEVNSDLVGGLSSYSIPIFKQRMSLLLEKIKTIKEMQQRAGANIHKLVINVLGDICDGEGIFVGQDRELAAFADEQVWDLGDYWVSHFYLPLLDMFETCDVHCVCGNHGRLGKKGEMHRLTNLDYFVYNLWRSRFRNRQDINFYLAKGSFHVYRELGKLHVITHGDQVRSYQGVPYYGVEKLVGKFQNMLGEHVFAIHMGHYHTPISIPTGRGGRLSISGAWVGGSEFSINRLTTASLPSQWLRTINHRGICAEWNLELERPIELGRQNGPLTPIKDFDCVVNVDE